MNCEKEKNSILNKYFEFINCLNYFELKEMIYGSKSICYDHNRNIFFLFRSMENPYRHGIAATVVADFSDGAVDQYPCDEDGWPIITNDDCEDLREMILNEGLCDFESLIE